MNGVEALRRIRKAELRLTALMERRRRCLELENGIAPGRSEELEALRRKLEAQAGEYAELAQCAEDLIDRVSDDTLRDVLRYRYLNGWSWQQIAFRMNYSLGWVKHLHGRAMKEVGRDK